MDEQVSSWRMIFGLACVLLILASIPPDRFLDPFAQTPRTYDAVRQGGEETGRSETPVSRPSREEREEEEIALSPSLRLASTTQTPPREVGRLPFELIATPSKLKAPPAGVFRLVSQTTASDATAFPAKTPFHEGTKAIVLTPAASDTVSNAGNSLDTASGPAAEPERSPAADNSPKTPLLVLDPPPRRVRRRSYDDLMERFSRVSKEASDTKPDQVIALPSPPPGEIRHPAWTPPKALSTALERHDTAEWSLKAQSLIAGLDPSDADRLTESLEALTRVHGEVAAAVKRAPKDERGAIRDTAAALERRLDVWRALIKAGWPSEAVCVPPQRDRRTLAAAAANVERRFANVPNRDAWNSFFGLPEVRTLAQDSKSEDEAIRVVARRILGRVMDAQWTSDEKSMLDAEPLASYIAGLRRWATGRVDLGRLLETLEQFEDSGNPHDARQLALAARDLRMSASPAIRRVGVALDRNYRGANCVMRVRTDFLNRFVPQREAEYEWVRDVILGQPVQGNARTESEVHFRSLPDEDRVLLALEVEGRVSSLTSADAGAAVLFNNSRSTYLASKRITLDAEGLSYEPSTVQVFSQTRLRGLRTALDPIPLVGGLMQDMVLSEHRRKEPYVRRELQRKVAAKARRRVDDEANPRLERLSDKYRDEVLARLAGLGIAPQFLDAETTEEGFVAAVRLAASDQLASYGPPPVLDSDAEVAVWMHETVLNNLLGRMSFNGKTFTAAELAGMLSRTSDAPAKTSLADKYGDVRVTFAPARAGPRRLPRRRRRTDVGY